MSVKPWFTGGRGVRRLKEARAGGVGGRLRWPPVDTDTH